MNTRSEGIMAMVAAMIVLFSAMWDPRISVAISIVAMVVFGAYKLWNKNG